MLERRKTNNYSMRIYLETIESIVGSHGLKSILNYAHLEKYIDDFPPFDDRLEIPLKDLQDLCWSLLELFGRKGIRSLQLRVGRQIIQKSLDKHSWIIKMVLLVRFLAPEHKIMQAALKKLINVVKKSYPPVLNVSQGDRLELQEQKDCFIIIFKDNWESEDIISQSPVCSVTVGSLEAFVQWATGHAHDVREVECRAMGHPADVFRISKFRKWEEEISGEHYELPSSMVEYRGRVL